MTPRNSEAPLIDALRAGRTDAFERLYADYHAPIYNLCARILGDREEAKDLTQEVFLKAFTDLPARGKKLKLRPWLYRVATNTCFNQLRDRKRSDGGDAVVEELPSRVDAFEQARTVALVEASLGEMNERYRTALVLKDLQGLPPEEIAEVMEVSRANADVLVHRARTSFKTVFAKLAGSDAAAPAALGLVLMPLSVPAALQAMPPLPLHLAPVHALPQPDISSAIGPTGAGLLTTIGAAAAAVVIGGGAVAVKESGRTDRGPSPAGAATAPAAAGSSSTYTGLRDGHWAGHETLRGEHGGAGHHADAGAHTADHAGGSHDSATHDAGHSAGSTATHDAGGDSTATHEAGGDSTTTTHESGTNTGSTGSHSAGTTTTHDGGATSSTHDGGSGD